MASKTVNVSLPPELSGYIERKIKGGHYHDASDVVRDALRHMEAAELATEMAHFQAAFANGHDRPESAEDVARVEHAIKAGRR